LKFKSVSSTNIIKKCL